MTKEERKSDSWECRGNEKLGWQVRGRLGAEAGG